MAMIYVRTKPGRRAWYEGRVIPEDKFIPVTDTPSVRRLIDHWGDIEVEGDAKPKAKPSQQPPAPQPAKAKEQ
ncbi:hypothetical protein [Bradyrhizobium sp. Leo170]|uniref:hypothetical protein n=1 Tax=Bradyrhizobium sp. Leo170 TaxID=1571199 RepID=UPI00102E69EB|nr:hypothetical protein [Bradyrhizobium sp. Leo170]TAI61581.1 hypothetical protein CWO89_34325 [Bradyrhizobium sp. Leo170]